MVAFIVQPGGGDSGVAQPLLDLGDIGAVQQGVGRRCGPQRMDAEAAHGGIDPDLLTVMGYVQDTCKKLSLCLLKMER